MLSVAFVLSACSAAAPSRPAATGTDLTVGSSAAPAAVPTPTGTSVPATLSPPSSGEPPAATLAVEGGDTVVGQLGSFTWGGGGSDSPWLPGAPIVIGPGEPLTVAVAGGVGVTEWTARRVPAGSTNGTGAVGLGTGGAQITFPAPPSGTWSVQVAVRFAANLGSATYYWQVSVR